MKSLARLHKFFCTHPLDPERDLSRLVRSVGWQIKSRIRSEVVDPGYSVCAGRPARDDGRYGNPYCGFNEFFDIMVLLHFLRANDLFPGYRVQHRPLHDTCIGRMWRIDLGTEIGSRGRGQSQANVELNSLQHLATVSESPWATGTATSPLPLARTRSTGSPMSDMHVRMVHQRPLDSVIGGRSPAMMKLDVEGYEEEVMAEANKTVENRRQDNHHKRPSRRTFAPS